MAVAGRKRFSIRFGSPRLETVIKSVLVWGKLHVSGKLPLFYYLFDGEGPRVTHFCYHFLMSNFRFYT